MVENESNTARWKRAQESEFKFYHDILRRGNFSQNYTYNVGAYDYKLKWFNLKEFDHKNILEVGSGVFGLIHFIRAKKAFKVGIDPLLGRLYKKVASRDIHYIRSVGENLPFASEKFDVVFCYNVLDHVINPKKVVKEIYRVLRNSGVFLLCVNTHPAIVRILTPLLEHLDERHPYHFTPVEVQNMVEARGFDVVHLELLKGFDDVPNPKYRVWLIKRILKLGRWKTLIALFFVPILYVTASKSAHDQRNQRELRQ